VNKIHYITFHFEFVMNCLMKLKQDKKCMGNRNCPGQHHICQGLYPYYSRIFPYFSIPMIILQTFQGLENFQYIFQTFPGSAQTPNLMQAYNESLIRFGSTRSKLLMFLNRSQSICGWTIPSLTKTVSTAMSDCLQVQAAFTPSWYLINHLGLTQPGHPCGFGKMNTSRSCAVNRLTMQYTSSTCRLTM